VFRELLLERVAGFCTLSATQLGQLDQHYELMLRWNRVINLTRIERVEEAVDRHYAESLFLGANLPAGPIRIADVGSGAGFPGFPIAILRPESRVTLIESHQRKAVFLKEACRGLPNIGIVAKRAEEVSASFDWVVSRAVSWDDIENVAFRLASKLAFLGSAPPKLVGANPCMVRLPWDHHRNLIIVSRET
jgi:16S rRNA (guanine(527)-N(7))-methyltransferase RsmG